MAIPIPRSYEQILADMLDGFLSKTDLDNQLKIGGAALSSYEAISQSQLKNSQDVFGMLDSLDIDRADELSLRNIAKSEKITLIESTFATGFVDIYDTSFSKISSNVYSGASAPNPGSLVIKVVDASNFPSSGNIYIGRNTNNYEGPLPYVSRVQSGNFWEITLSTNTVKFHNTGESVILAQGGVRKIISGTVVQTPQGNVDEAISFSLLYNAQIDDGEVRVSNIEVIAKERGVIGNIPANAIKEVVGSPFIGAAATNPLPFTNGLPNQSVESIRDAIKKARQNRSKATDQALLNAITGVSSSEENKTVIGSSLINRQDVYIDDGLGYEEIVTGVAQEVLTNSALGTERYFQLENVPVAKAFLKTEFEAPFNITPGQVLSIKVGGIISDHVFASESFREPSNATAYELAAAINSDSNCLFGAKTSDQAKKLCVFAKSTTEEDVELVKNLNNDANESLGFPNGIQYTLRLYKNDKLLYKDGRVARLASNPQTLWDTFIASGETLLIEVDSGAVQTVTITDLDFIKNLTGFNTVKSTNSVTAWAKVLNKKIIGATTRSSLNSFYIQSNLGTNSDASIKIVGGTLVTKGFFEIDAFAQGSTNDYTLNRNTGQIKLKSQLSKGDSLIASTSFTKAYVQSSLIQNPLINLSSTAKIWFTVDSESQNIPVVLNSSTSINITEISSTVARYTSNLFAFGSSDEDAVRVGDWMIVWDPNFTMQGVFRVTSIAGSVNNYSWVEVATYTGITIETVVPTSQGIVFVRSNNRPIQIDIPSGSYSLFDIKEYINSNYKNLYFDIYKNKNIRFQTNTFDLNTGNILLVTLNTEAYKLFLSVDGVVQKNSYPHLGYIESGNSQLGTPRFDWEYVSTKDGTSFTIARDIGASAGDFLYIPKSLDISDPQEFRDSYFSMESDTLAGRDSNTYTPRNIDTNLLVPGIDRIVFRAPFNIGPDEDLVLLIDKDQQNQKYEINLFKNAIFAPGTTYSNPTLEIRDADNGQVNFYDTIGESTNFFNDFSFNLQAKGKSNSVNLNKTILWRSVSYGGQGSSVRISYVNPILPSAPLAFTVDSSDGLSNIKISLPSGTLRSGTNLNNLNYFNITGNLPYSGVANRVSNVVTVNLAGANKIYGLSVNDYLYQVEDDSPNFRKGPKKLTVVNSAGFSYSETGSDSSSSDSLTYLTVPKAAGLLHTITSIVSSGSQIVATIGSHNFKVGDTVYFSPGLFDSTNNITVIYGNKTITAIGANTISWSEATSVGTATLSGGITYTISPESSTKITISQYTSQAVVGSLSRTSNIVTAILVAANNITQHPYSSGDIVYLTTNEANFLSGAKIITATTSTTFSYYEIGTNAVSTIIHNFSSTPTNPNFSSVIVGDIARVSSDTTFTSSAVSGAHKVLEVKTTSFTFAMLGGNFTNPSIPKKLNSINNLVFYPINTTSSKASDIVTWSNLNLTNFVSAKLVPENGGSSNNGTGVVSNSTIDDYISNTTNGSVDGTTPDSLKYWSLFDGINFINQTDINSTSTTISLKTPISGELVANADIENDKIKLVPITTQGLIRFLSSLSVTGLSANAEISSSNRGENLQINSKKIGSNGAVQVLGGSANASYGTIVGSGEALGSFSKVRIPIGQIKGFNVESFVNIKNSIPLPKVNSFDENTSVYIAPTSSPNQWEVEVSGLINVKQSFNASDFRWYQIERHGDFWAYIDVSDTPLTLSPTIVEGDWVNISGTNISESNQGLKQIVRIQGNTFWVKDEQGEEEVISTDEFALDFISFDSPTPGDILTIGSNKFEQNNIGNFTVIDFVFASSTGISNIVNSKVIVSGDMIEETVVLGSEYFLFNFISEKPLSLTKKIKGIVLSTNNQYAEIIFDTSSYIEKFSSSGQATIEALDKLNFNLDINVGADGYKYNTGLLAEVNKVLYGDESNPTIYPGYVAAGANINISGSIIKRIEIGLAVRTTSGNSDLSLVGRIKSTVAALINSTLMGVSIAISDIISAVNNINGVISVVIISPEYNSVNDFIPIQPNEKPKVLDLDKDILISFI